MARALGWLLLSGPSLVLVWLVLPHAAGATEAAMLAIIFAAWALGALLLSGWVDDRSPRFFAAVVGVSTLMISGLVFFSDSPTTELGFLYLWVVPVAYAFFPLRQAVLVTALSTITQAHFKLLEPASWLIEDDRGDPQKAGPCGGTLLVAAVPCPWRMSVNCWYKWCWTSSAWPGGISQTNIPLSA